MKMAATVPRLPAKTPPAKLNKSMGASLVNFLKYTEINLNRLEGQLGKPSIWPSISLISLSKKFLRPIASGEFLIIKFRKPKGEMPSF